MAGNEAVLLQGTLDMLILKALSAEPNHGFGVARWIEETTGERLHVEEGALYPALHRLRRRGWLAAAWGRSDANRRAKFYRLTEEGERELASRMDLWERASSAINQVLGAAGT